jgi:suppressor of G2 allele of SKP1
MSRFPHPKMAEALQRANALFVDEKFEEALAEYTKALSVPSKEAYLKRSACHYKLENFTDAVADATSAINLDPQDPRGYMRKGMACFALDEYEAAKAAFEKGYQLEPTNSNFKTWIRKCNAELEIEEEEEQKEAKKTKLDTPESQQQTQTSSSQASNQPTSQQIPQQTTTPKQDNGLATQPQSNHTSSNTVQPIDKPPANNAIFAPPLLNITVIGNIKIRREWYQTNSHVIVTVFAKNVPKESTVCTFKENSLFFLIKLAEGDYKMDIVLFDKIIPEESSATYLSTKVELKMKKRNQSAQWKTLESTGEKPTAAPIVDSTLAKSTKSKNWDKIANEVANGENLDEESDPLNKVFKDIYANASDDQKRAMQKSFLESGGTVLSTNWEEVGKGKVQGSPPQGMEMHSWNE